MRGCGLQLSEGVWLAALWKFVLLLCVTWEKFCFHVYVKDLFFLSRCGEKKCQCKLCFVLGREGGNAEMRLVGLLVRRWKACS